MFAGVLLALVDRAFDGSRSGNLIGNRTWQPCFWQPERGAWSLVHTFVVPVPMYGVPGSPSPNTGLPSADPRTFGPLAPRCFRAVSGSIPPIDSIGLAFVPAKARPSFWQVPARPRFGGNPLLHQNHPCWSTTRRPITLDGVLSIISKLWITRLFRPGNDVESRCLKRLVHNLHAH